MSLDGWAYVSGMCAARQTLFFSNRALEELGGLSPRELAARLSRSFFGPVEPISAFDRIAAARLRRELDELAGVSPSGEPVDIIRARLAADRIRMGLAELPQQLDPRELERFLSRLCLRAETLSERFASAIGGNLPEPSGRGQLAASLLIDSAELIVILELAESAKDAAMLRWAESCARMASGRVARRALNLGLPREAMGFFFRGRLFTDSAREFLANWNERSASAISPEISEDAEENMLLEIARSSVAEPFSPGRVLHYLLEFRQQNRLIRHAVYKSLGWLPADRSAAA